MLKIVAKENDHGRTLLKFVAKILQNYSTSQIEKLLEKEIKVNKNHKQKYIVQQDDIIQIYTNEKLDKLKTQELENQTKIYT